MTPETAGLSSLLSWGGKKKKNQNQQIWMCVVVGLETKEYCFLISVLWEKVYIDDFLENTKMDALLPTAPM